MLFASCFRTLVRGVDARRLQGSRGLFPCREPTDHAIGLGELGVQKLRAPASQFRPFSLTKDRRSACVIRDLLFMEYSPVCPDRMTPRIDRWTNEPPKRRVPPTRVKIAEDRSLL